MPAADIKEVSVTWHDERRGPFEYNPPMKKAEVHLYATVPEGGDGVAALNYISLLAKAKAAELLSGTAAAEPEAIERLLPPTSSASPASTDEAAAPGEPQRRTRRTKAQIEADAAAAAAGQSALATVSDPQSAAGLAAGAATSEQDAPAISAQQTGATTPPSGDATTPTTAPSDDDEWAAAAPETATIPDTELNHTCSVQAERLKEGGALKVKAVIGSFSPGGDAWDPAKGGRKFLVNDIPQSQRADFIAKLKALT